MTFVTGGAAICAIIVLATLIPVTIGKRRKRESGQLLIVAKLSVTFFLHSLARSTLIFIDFVPVAFYHIYTSMQCFLDLLCIINFIKGEVSPNNNVDWVGRKQF